jgi:transposase
MNKARFHNSDKTKKLIESVYFSILHLPLYSLDLNPIKKKWGFVKKIILQYDG